MNSALCLCSFAYPFLLRFQHTKLQTELFQLVSIFRPLWLVLSLPFNFGHLCDVNSIQISLIVQGKSSFRPRNAPFLCLLVSQKPSVPLLPAFVPTALSSETPRHASFCTDQSTYPGGPASFYVTCKWYSVKCLGVFFVVATDPGLPHHGFFVHTIAIW